MHIRELTLTNVRQFEHRTFSFQPGFNLLVGENGEGKTTILRSILMALGKSGQAGRQLALDDEDVRLRSERLEVEVKMGGNDGLNGAKAIYQKRLGRRAWRRQWRLNSPPLVVFYGSKESVCASFVSKKNFRIPNAASSRLSSEEDWLYQMESRDLQEDLREEINNPQPVRLFGRSRVIREFVARILRTFSERFLDFGWTFEPYHCVIRPKGDDPLVREFLRDVGSALPAAIMRHFREDREERGVRSPYSSLRSVDRESVTFDSSGRMVDAKGPAARIPPFSELLRHFGSEWSSHKGLESITVEVKLKPRILIRSQDGMLLLSQLSDGEQRLFSLFVDIARQLLVLQQYPSKANFPFLRNQAIVLIDEIDVHLHPKWQRKIVPALEDLFPACQFIATTHSPFVVQAVQEVGVQHLNRDLAGDFTDRGIEEIALKVMGIQDHQVGERYLEMLDTARQYFQLLQEAKNTAPGRRAQLKARLDSLAQRYARNPAYQAYLELHGQLALNAEELR